MKSLGLFSLLAVVGLSFIIGYFYVQPTIAEIGETQTEITRYETERKKIEAINSRLATHLATLESIPPADKTRLATYMPRVVDDISIMRDISLIVEQANITTNTLSYNGPLEGRTRVFSQNDGTDSSLGDQAATAHSFTVDVQGSYNEIKDFFRLLELNEYPLEVYQLSLRSNDEAAVQQDESAPMTAAMTLVTYEDDLALVNGN